VQLTPVPGSTQAPTAADEKPIEPPSEKDEGPNDERMRRDVPPHW